MLAKDFRIDSKKLRDSANGEECTFNVAGVCKYDKATTVLCHSGENGDGKGWGKKGSDLFAAMGLLWVAGRVIHGLTIKVTMNQKDSFTFTVQ